MMQRVIRGSLALAAAGVLALGTRAEAKLVTNDLTGNVQFDGWDNPDDNAFGFIAGYGAADVGFLAPPGTPWPAPIGSFEPGSGDAELDRTFGEHYSATFSLYTFTGPSGFVVFDDDALTDVETIVFTIARWGGSSTDPVLNFNGGAQEVAADFTSSSPFSSVEFGGTFTVFADTFQWDVSSLGVTEFELAWIQGSSNGIVGLQLEQSDVFTIASAEVVPEPTALVLVGTLLGSSIAFRRNRLSS